MIFNGFINKLIFLCTLVFILGATNGYGAQHLPDSSAITVPLGGNGWLSKNARANIGETGLTNWISGNDVITVYIQLESAGILNISLRLALPDGSSKIRVTAGKTVLVKTIAKCDTQVVSFGNAEINSPGYLQIKLKGLLRTGAVYANVTDLILSGTAISKGAAYVKNNQGNYYYWGHRGPSVHLNYKVPDEAKEKIEWFYNEVTVPVGNDVLGSYFMADGFNGGYFGMQVNSSTERHILFSVWSPFTTDDLKSIPDSLSIKLLKKGAGVQAGAFGSEGSGGQSYLSYSWVAGKTYAFLIHARADAILKTTEFTAWFKPKNENKWLIIASFKRPASGFYLNGLYSFLENFEPDMGNVTRKVLFGSEWVADTAGKWYPIKNALFTADATANINYRKDYSGGVTGNQFFLRNCGFFDDFTRLKTNLTRQSLPANPPDIDFKQLP